MFKGLHGTIHLTAVFFFLQRLALVELLLTLAKGDVHLGTSVLVDEYQERHYGVTRLFGSRRQFGNFTLRKQQFAVTLQFMVVVGTIEIGRYIHALHPQLAIDDGAIGVNQRSLTQTDALNLRTRKDYAGSELLDEEIFKRGFLVLYLDRTFLPNLFLFLIQNVSTFNFELSIFNCRKAIDVFVNVAGNLFRPFFLFLHKGVVKVVEFRKLFEQGHKFVVRTVAFQLLAVIHI